MKPSFVLVDRITGDLIEKHELPPELHQLSIRHMDIDRSGTVWFGCQYQGPDTDRPPLVGRRARGKDLELVDMPQDVLAGFNNYTGSIAANRAAGTVAVSSPQGNALAVIDAASGESSPPRRSSKSAAWRPTETASWRRRAPARSSKPAARHGPRRDYVWDNHVLRIEQAA